MFSKTHTWIVPTKYKPYFCCSICRLKGSDSIRFTFGEDELVTDGLPIYNYLDRYTIYLTCEQNQERKALKKIKDKPWIVYIIQCFTFNLYTGITNNLWQRFMDHKRHRGAKFTKFNPVDRIVYTETFDTKSEAAKREYEIKQFTRDEKLDLIKRLSNENK